MCKRWWCKGVPRECAPERELPRGTGALEDSLYSAWLRPLPSKSSRLVFLVSTPMSFLRSSKASMPGFMRRGVPVASAAPTTSAASGSQREREAGRLDVAGQGHAAVGGGRVC